MEWHNGDLFPGWVSIVTNSTLRTREVVRAYNGRAYVENRIKVAENTLRWDKTSCHRFDANQARPEMRALAYNLPHMIREFHLQGRISSGTWGGWSIGSSRQIQGFPTTAGAGGFKISFFRFPVIRLESKKIGGSYYG
ncbi:MAG: transposase [Proteobacteria bacterium]|nr:transposase [Pseudomonadota bacterium]MBU1451430.1 transposase [Pseudomonadota bacterium]MBU2468081.1 transposase [Pseudomonadota bacterium]MBU2517487.1 transposase [Pseudomonadota bacterium]